MILFLIPVPAPLFFLDIGYPSIRAPVVCITLIRALMLASTLLHSICNHLQHDVDREHVIDAIPGLWSLDGRIIATAERQRVARLFAEGRPDLRRKVKQGFVSSATKDVRASGVFGPQTEHMMRYFPAVAARTMSPELDEKRLRYTAYLVENRLPAWGRRVLTHAEGAALRAGREFGTTGLETLLCADAEERNMLYLLMAASLDFALPTQLMATTLEMAHISKVRGFVCMQLFLLPAAARALVVTLFVSASALERANGRCGGLYPKLHRCLQQTSMLLLRLAQCPRCALPAASSEARRAKSSLRCAGPPANPGTPPYLSQEHQHTPEVHGHMPYPAVEQLTPCCPPASTQSTC